MSETTKPIEPLPAEPAVIVQPAHEQAALVSSSPANQSTAAASSASAGAVVVILVWALGAAGLVVPADVAAAFTVLASAVVHWSVIKYGIPSMS